MLNYESAYALYKPNILVEPTVFSVNVTTYLDTRRYYALRDISINADLRYSGRR